MEQEEEEAGRGSGLKSRGLFNLVITGTALKTDLGRSESEDIALKPPHCQVCVQTGAAFGTCDVLAAQV